jgi:hypothetical protein
LDDVELLGLVEVDLEGVTLAVVEGCDCRGVTVGFDMGRVECGDNVFHLLEAPYDSAKAGDDGVNDGDGGDELV